MNRIRWYGPTIVLLLTAVVVMILGPGLTRQIAHAHKAQELQMVRDELKGSGALAELSSAFRQVGVVVRPSVVHIQTSVRGHQQPMGGGGNLMDDPRWRWFFGPRGEGNQGETPGSPGGPGIPGMPDLDDQNPDNSETPAPGNPRNPHAPRNRRAPQQNNEMEQYDIPQPLGTGSGWVFDEEGHIITNNHVITIGDRVTVADIITVRFADGSQYQAKVVGTDPKTDVAVLKVVGGKFHPAKRSENQVEQGDMVFAFGSPFQYDFSMSQGIVSAKGREIGILEGGYENFIQTDAAINPGNSGGPLTDIYGQVIGMNTLIASRTGSFNGLGFAIPVSIIEHVATSLIKEGKVIRGYLGIAIQELDPKMAHSMGLAGGQGVLVNYPMPGTPAEKAGIKSGDIITKVDGKAVRNTNDLRFLVADKRPGEELKLEIFRDGKTLEQKVAVAELPTAAQMARGNGGGGAKPEQAAPPSSDQLTAEQRTMLMHMGFEDVTAFTPQLAEQAGVPFQPGVLVERVRRNSAAWVGRFTSRTIVTHVKGDPVTTPAELAVALQKADTSKGIHVRVLTPNPAGEGLVPGYRLLEFASP